jgi:hypothetical protein
MTEVVRGVRVSVAEGFIGFAPKKATRSEL